MAAYVAPRALAGVKRVLCWAGRPFCELRLRVVATCRAVGAGNIGIRTDLGPPIPGALSFEELQPDTRRRDVRVKADRVAVHNLDSMHHVGAAFSCSVAGHVRSKRHHRRKGALRTVTALTECGVQLRASSVWSELFPSGGDNVIISAVKGSGATVPELGPG